jgi:hypothetical protein
MQQQQRSLDETLERMRSRTVEIGSTKGFQHILDAERVCLGFWVGKPGEGAGSTVIVELSDSGRETLTSLIRQARISGTVGLHGTPCATVWIDRVSGGNVAPFGLKFWAEDTNA